jgi:hypothetical protein
MKSSPGGLVPARGFLKEGMAPRPSFNDGSNPGRFCFPLIQFTLRFLSFPFVLEAVMSSGILGFQERFFEHSIEAGDEWALEIWRCRVVPFSKALNSSNCLPLHQSSIGTWCCFLRRIRGVGVALCCW